MSIQVSIVTPERMLDTIEVDSVTAPGEGGELGILEDHRPLLSTLQAGELLFRQGSKTLAYAVSGGYLEVENNRVTVLAEAAERADEIDVERAEKAFDLARAKLKSLSLYDDDYKACKLSFDCAQARIAVSKHKRILT